MDFPVSRHVRLEFLRYSFWILRVCMFNIPVSLSTSPLFLSSLEVTEILRSEFKFNSIRFQKSVVLGRNGHLLSILADFTTRYLQNRSIGSKCKMTLGAWLEVVLRVPLMHIPLDLNKTFKDKNFHGTPIGLRQLKNFGVLSYATLIKT